MKKTIVTCILLLAAAVAIALPVDKKRAARVATNAVLLLSAEQHRLDTKQPVELTDVSDALGFGPYLHIFKYRYSGIEGFVVISGDDVAAPLLAFSDEGELDLSGTFDEKHPDKNPAFIQQLLHYTTEIQNAVEAKATATHNVARKWQQLESGEALAKGDIYNDIIPKLLGNMVWGQREPYNNKCPGGSVTGCVATALGMIMNYWDYPEHGFGRHSYNGASNPAAYPSWTYGVLGADFENTYYDWEHMEDVAFRNSPTEVINAISTLLFHIGVALDMHYTPDGSGCWSLPEYAIFDTSLHLSPEISINYRIPKHFGYKFSYAGMRDSIGDDTLWLNMLYNSLAEGKPIYYAGWAKDTNEFGHSGTSGHGYVIDGYFSDAIDSNFFHINWGWSGTADGHFKLDAMTPDDYDFTQWHGAVIGMEPDTTYHGYDYTGITSPTGPQVSAYARNNGSQSFITIKNAQHQRVMVYDMMGRLVSNHVATSVDWSIGVHPGFYTVRVGNAPAKKILAF